MEINKLIIERIHIKPFAMPATQTLFTLVFVAVFGHLVSSLPTDGEIFRSGPNTYTIGGDDGKVRVVARRIPAIQSVYEMQLISVVDLTTFMRKNV